MQLHHSLLWTLHMHTLSLSRPGSRSANGCCLMHLSWDLRLWDVLNCRLFTVPAKLSAIIDPHSLDTENKLNFSFWDMVSDSICWLQTHKKLRMTLNFWPTWLTSKSCFSVHATHPAYETLRTDDRTSCFQGKYSTNWATFSVPAYNDQIHLSLDYASSERFLRIVAWNTDLN